MHQALADVPLWGGIMKWRRNSFLNEVSERFVSFESSSIEYP